MQDVLAADQRNDVRRLEAVLNVNGVRTRLKPVAAANTIHTDFRDHVRFRVLQAYFLRNPQSNRRRHKPVSLPVVAEPEFVDESRADRPHVRNLGGETAHIPMLAVVGAGEFVLIECVVVSRGDRKAQAVLTGNVVVDSPEVPDERIRTVRHELVVRRKSGKIGSGIERLKGTCPRIELADPVVWEGVAADLAIDSPRSRRIENLARDSPLPCAIINSSKRRSEEGREIALPHGIGRNRSEAVIRAFVVDFVDVEVEEQFLLYDRPTDRPAKVVVPQIRRRTEWIEEASGIERIVPNIFVSCPVEATGPAFTDLIEYGTADAILRRERRGADLNFGYGLKSSNVDVGAERQCGRSAVREKVAVKGQVAVHRDASTGVGYALASGRSTRRTGEQDGKVGPILANLRQLRHDLRFKSSRLLSSFRLQQLHIGRDHNFLADRAHLQHAIHSDDADFERDGAAHILFKTFFGESDSVVSGQDR